jgi:hypothetical protein
VARIGRYFLCCSGRPYHCTKALAAPRDTYKPIDSWEAADLQEEMFNDQVNLTVGVDEDPDDPDSEDYETIIKMSGTAGGILQKIHDFYRDKQKD